MKFRNILAAVALASVATSGFAAGGKKAAKEPNCEVNGKKEHVKDEAACTKKKGKWMAAGATETAAPAPAAEAPAAAPAEGTK